SPSGPSSTPIPAVIGVHTTFAKPPGLAAARSGCSGSRKEADVAASPALSRSTTKLTVSPGFGAIGLTDLRIDKIALDAVGAIASLSLTSGNGEPGAASKAVATAVATVASSAG